MAEWIDEARRQIGKGLDALGLGPQETPHRIVAEFPGARLRAYHDQPDGEGPVLLIAPAPFKKAYIWDLLPDVSVVRCCMRRGLRVYLLEWTVPNRRHDEFGLAEYADRLPRLAMDAIESETGASATVLAGHSLGGTFAAIFTSLHPERVSGLLLLDAPIAFGEHGGPLARAVAASPHAHVIRLAAGSPVPGWVIDTLSVAAAPDTFEFQRSADILASLPDAKALAIHTRVERWALDELPMPGQLFEEIFEQLYRDDRFLNGTLRVGERQTGVDRLRSPVMAVINPVGGIVPPRSVLEGLASVPNLSLDVLEYEGDRGSMLQHLGPLVGPRAHERLWPKILDWADHLPWPSTGA